MITFFSTSRATMHGTIRTAERPPDSLQGASDRSFGQGSRKNGINLVSFSPAILSDPRLSCHLTYTCDPVRRIVTVERTVGKVMFTLQF